MEQETPTPPAAPLPASAGHCANCGAPLYGKYCYACGQPAEGLVRHFGSVAGDIADSVFNLDARLVRTLVPLYLRPARLTLDYFAGRRARYVTPFRLVFFLAIVVFLGFQLVVRLGPDRAAPLAAVGPDVSSAPQSSSADARAGGGVFGQGNIRFNDRIVWNRTVRPLHIARLPDAANSWLNDLVGHAQEQLHAMNSGPPAARLAASNRMIVGMFAAAPTAMFLLLPVFALVLKLFYLFRHRLYMEHLIIAMHSQAFLLLSLLALLVIGLLRSALAPHAHWLYVLLAPLEAAVWIWMFVYIWLMQRRVYRQGWIMTTVKYCLIGWCYLILFGLGTAFAALVSLTGA